MFGLDAFSLLGKAQFGISEHATWVEHAGCSEKTTYLQSITCTILILDKTSHHTDF